MEAYIKDENGQRSQCIGLKLLNEFVLRDITVEPNQENR